MERFFQVLAVILAGVAAYFLWQGNADRAFVSAVCGAVSFFLSVRVQVKGRLRQREIEEEEKRRREEDENFESPLLNDVSASSQINHEQLTTDNEQIK